MANDEKFKDLINRAMAGSDRAIEELFRNYEPYLLKAIRKKLPQKLRSKFDSLDFAQEVWASFFAEPRDKRTFNRPEELIAFLTRLAQNKVIDTVRQQLMTTKYNVNREQSLDDSTRFAKGELIGPGDTPSQIVSSEEEWNEFLRKQPLVYRRIFIMLREGKTAEMISKELGIHIRTVFRVACRLNPGSSS